MILHKTAGRLQTATIELFSVICLLASFTAYSGEGKIALELSPGKMFYSSSENAELTMKIIMANGSLNGSYLKLSLQDSAGNTVYSEKIKELLLLSTVKIPINDLAEGKYFISVAILDKNGIQIAEKPAFFYKIPETDKKIQRLFITKEGIPVLDRKPALLRIVWLGGGWEGPIGKKDLKAIADQGFDAVVAGEVYMKEEALRHYEKYPSRGGGGVRKIVEQSKFKNFNELLDALGEYGLGCFAHMGEITARFPELKPCNLEDAGNFILKYRKNPAIFGWYSLDETDAWDKTNRELYRAIKEADPLRPVWLNVIGEINTNRDTCDILSSDPYPVGKSKVLNAVSAKVSAIVKAQQGLSFKSPWIILQMFASPWEGWPRPPTPREERCMTYLALNHGAKALGYFAHQRLDTIPKSKRITPELWDSMKLLNAETKEMGIPYLLGKRLEGIKCDSSVIDVAAILYKDKTFVIAVNPSGDEISAGLNVGTIRKSGEATVKSEPRKAVIKEGVLQDKFLPYDTHIYIFE